MLIFRQQIMDGDGIPLDDDELLAKFNRASDFVTGHAAKMQQDDLLYLYGRYKQATAGRCTEAIPGLFNFRGRSKWQAWNGLGNLSKESAMSEYIGKVSAIDPGWDTAENRDKKTFGPVPSTYLKTDPEIEENLKTAFDFVKENDLERLQKLCASGKLKIDSADEDGLSLLHWACDRGHVNIATFLISSGINVNSQDGDGQTALHYASSCGHGEVIALLLKNNAFVEIKDSSGLRPCDVAYSDSVKSLLLN